VFMRVLGTWLLVLLVSVGLHAAEPRFYLPLDGNGNIISPDGEKMGAANITGASDYVDGINGKALDGRQAYDQVTALNIGSLPSMAVREGTVSFWFRPEWNAGEREEKCLFYSWNDPQFRFFLVKPKADTLEFSVFAPNQLQVIVKNSQKAKEWVHLAVRWSVPKGEVAIFINGKCAGRNVKEEWKKASYDAKSSLNLWFGKGGSDRFKAIVGDGAYDDFRIYDKQLSDNEIQVEALGGNSETLQTRSLTYLRQSDKRIDLRFHCPVKSYASSRSLFNLQCGDAKISLSTTGSSQKLVLNSGNDVLESPYTIDLRRPLTITFLPDKKQRCVEVLFDGASQGFLKLSSECGNVTSLEAFDALVLDPVSDTPSDSDIAALTTKATDFENTLWTLNDAEHRSASDLRDAVCLNGLWRIFRDESYSYAPIKDGRQEYSRVPGSFTSSYYSHYYLDDGQLKKVDNCAERHEGSAGWYQRTFTVPEKWGGKQVFLNLEDIKANYARVYLNGKLIDSFNNQFKYFTFIPRSNRINITDLLKKENVVSVYLERFFTRFWRGKMPDATEHYKLGLDNVWLEAAPSRLTLKNAIAFPSFRKKTLEMRTRIHNPFGVKGSAQIEFRYLINKKTAKNFIKDFELTGEPEQAVAFTENWKDPLLWTAETPQLYQQSVQLKVNGQAADVLPDSGFGFRELWVENGEFKINGQKLRMRMWTCPGSLLNEHERMLYGYERTAPQIVALVKQMNYDTIRMSPLSTGSSDFGYRYYLDETNRRGVYNLMPMPPYAGGDQEPYRKEVEAYLEYFGPHPSIAMWYTDFNTCSYPWNQDPEKLNDTDYVPAFKQKARELAHSAEGVMRSLDPSREVFQHAGGNSGKIFTSMNYQSFGVPVQEREDWPKQWSEKHTQPLMVVETGFPFPSQYEYFIEDYEMSWEWMYAEHAARFFGDSVYRDEVSPVAQQIPRRKSYLHSIRMNDNMLKISDMLYRKVVPAWRAYDMSAIGDFASWTRFFHAYIYNHLQKIFWNLDNDIKSAGAKPDYFAIPWGVRDFDFSKKQKLFWTAKEVFSPLLVYLGGRTDDFTNKDHAFFSNEQFEKSIVIVNDKLTPQNLKLRWEFTAAGKTVSRGEIIQKVDPSAIVKLPIPLQAPEVSERTDAKLHLDTFQDGAAFGNDDMAVQIFPIRRRGDYRSVNAGLYDPVGKTEAMLKKAEFPFRKVSTFDEAKQCRLLIIGQNALGEVLPDFLRELEVSDELTRGYKILFFEQKQCNVANLVFESPSYRNAFIRRPDSAYVRGLKTEDFSDWRGPSDTVPEFVLSDERSPHYPRSKWKCGNGGIVAGNVIRKPSYGNFSTIVDCGFNLMFAGLLQLKKDRGLLLFCQLDVTSRYGTDPVATQLVDNLLAEMSIPAFPAGAQTAVYIGDDDNAALLARMGMSFTRIQNPSNPDQLKPFGVIVLGKDAVPEAFKEKFRKAWEKIDCTFVVLPGAPLDILPGGLKREKTDVFRAELPANEPLLCGIPEADLYYRFSRVMEVLTPSSGVIGTQPGIFGRYQLNLDSIVALNLSPTVFTDHFWNEEKVSRVWTGIFNNLNLSLGKDLKCFTGTKMRANTIIPAYGKIPLQVGELKLDMDNSGKVSDTEGFKPLKLGTSWEEQGFTQNNPHYQYPAGASEKLKQMYDGYGWIRIKVKIPASWKPYKIRLKGGPIDDADWTYFNEVKIGETTLDRDPKAYASKRDYLIPSEVIRYGEENTIMIRVFDRWGGGGVTGPLELVAEDTEAKTEWTPYIDNLNFYDVDAFHNW